MTNPPWSCPDSLNAVSTSPWVIGLKSVLFSTGDHRELSVGLRSVSAKPCPLEVMTLPSGLDLIRVRTSFFCGSVILPFSRLVKPDLVIVAVNPRSLSKALLRRALMPP